MEEINHVGKNIKSSRCNINGAHLKMFFLYIYAFLFIYTPTNFFPIHIMHILVVIAVFYFSLKWRGFYKFLKSKFYISSVLIFIYLITILLVHQSLGNSVDFYAAYSYAILFLEVPICSFFIIYHLNKNIYLNDNSLLKYCFFLGLGQLVFILFTLLSPSLRDLILSTSRGGELLVHISNNTGGLRSFGLASGYTSDLGMILGVFSMVCISMMLRNVKTINMLFLAVFFIIGAVINSRTGLAAPIIFLFFAFFLFSFNFIIVLGLGGGLSIVAVIVLLNFNLEGALDSFGRVLIMWEEVWSLFQGRRIGVFSALTDMHFFPKDSSIFWFGRGKSVFSDNFIHSDIGYVNDIYLMGLFNLIIVAFLFFKLHWKTFSLLKLKLKLAFFVSLFVSLFIFYFKGVNLFTSNSLTNFLFLISVGVYGINALNRKYPVNRASPTTKKRVFHEI